MALSAMRAVLLKQHQHMLLFSINIILFYNNGQGTCLIKIHAVAFKI